MAYRAPNDFKILDLDPFQEIVGQVVRRQKGKKLKEYLVSEVTFVHTLFVFLECLMPTCVGHRKFGMITSENLPVIFKYHDYGEEAKYVPYKNPICKPLRVPLDGDLLLIGIKWRLSDPVSILSVTQGFFDCLFVCLKFLCLTRYFCLECLFRHSNGIGLGLERFLKTILGHIVVYGRLLERDYFNPIRYYEQGMSLKFRRIYWKHKNEMFKCACVCTKTQGVKEEFCFQIPNTFVAEYPPHIKHGFFLDPNLMFLRHLNTVSTIHVITQCKCNDGRPMPQLVYIGLIRQNKRNAFLNISLSKWDQEGNEYSDPLINWSLMGPENTQIPLQTKILPVPLTTVCTGCHSQISIKDIFVPQTTWLFMAEISEPLQKCPVDCFANLTDYVIGGVTFELKFILLYNTSNGNFTSIHLVNGKWFFFDDQTGGIFKKCNTDKVKYKDRVNLRACYLRKTPLDPHTCLENAARLATTSSR